MTNSLFDNLADDLSNLFDSRSDIVRKQYTEYRAMYAQIVYDLLRIAEVSNGLHYNDRHTIIVDEVQLYFAETGVDITFDDPYGDEGNTQFIRVAAPYTPTAVATVVQGILHLLNTGCTPSTSDNPVCCGKPMTEGDPETWLFPGEPLYLEQVYHCRKCHHTKRIEVTEPRGAAVAVEVTQS